ncbi:hypothetical protein GIB67_023047 [Kingdonia uniflora]|uniref:Uncharacterized protein n=1 Tax=Kingdonia uniflora TaxID=39325 RepID=A0A7J7LB99_9MAGN|nr:hypothetical protein GIB67_023047 [Kingdonia uniflora]
MFLGCISVLNSLLTQIASQIEKVFFLQGIVIPPAGWLNPNSSSADLASSETKDGSASFSTRSFERTIFIFNTSRRNMGIRLWYVSCKTDSSTVTFCPNNGHKCPKRSLCCVYGESQKKRFTVPLSYLSHPSFQDLLSRAEEEFGFNHPMGGLTFHAVKMLHQYDLRIE